MLALKNVSISTLSDKEMIKDVSFVIDPGDKLCIIGEEGNGKSTLMKWIYDETMVTSYAKVEGSIQKEGTRLGYLEQFLDPAWEEIEVVDYLLKDTVDAEVPYERYNEIAKLYPLFQKLHLKQDYVREDKKIKTLSGGEKVKIQLVKLLMQEPDILLLDEPTNDLDIATLEWLEQFILQQTIPIMYISHDEVLLEKTANAVLHLERIQNKTQARTTYEQIGYKAYLQKRHYLVEKQNQMAKNEKKEYDKQMQRYRQVFQRVEHEQNVITRQDPSTARLLKKKMKSVKALGRRLEDKELTQKVETEESIIAKFHHETSIHSHQKILKLHEEHILLRNGSKVGPIDLEVVGREKVCIIGENGVGKTTLLQHIYEKLKESKKWNIGYMPQEYDTLLPLESTPIEFLKWEYTKEEETLARTYMGSMKFTQEEMESKIGNLSGGQKAKLFLLKLILLKCDVCILDEPTRNLSPLSGPVIRTFLQSYPGAIISVSHDRKYMQEVCSSIYEWKDTGLQKLV